MMELMMKTMLDVIKRKKINHQDQLKENSMITLDNGNQAPGQLTLNGVEIKLFIITKLTMVLMMLIGLLFNKKLKVSDPKSDWMSLKYI